MSTNNILSPANGKPIIVPSQDVVLGLYYMTRSKINAKGEGTVFTDYKEAIRALYNKAVETHSVIRARVDDWVKDESGEYKPKTRIVETTVGRLLLWGIVPKGMSFDQVNQPKSAHSITLADV